jgi:hypothetical protein
MPIGNSSLLNQFGLEPLKEKEEGDTGRNKKLQISKLRARKGATGWNWKYNNKYIHILL